MSVRDFRDLVCWRLSHALKCEVFEFTATGPASRDFKYRDQIRDSSASAPRNIAEAFGRFRPRDAARFAEFAGASLQETRNHLIDGRDRKYLSPELCSRLMNLADQALRATTNWMLYLKRCDPDIGKPETRERQLRKTSKRRPKNLEASAERTLKRETEEP